MDLAGLVSVSRRGTIDFVWARVFSKCIPATIESRWRKEHGSVIAYAVLVAKSAYSDCREEALLVLWMKTMSEGSKYDI